MGVAGVLTPWKYVGGVRVCFDPLKFFHSKLLLDNCNFHIVKDETLASKMDGKTNISRRLKQFDGLTWLTLTPPLTSPLILRQICATGYNSAAMGRNRNLAEVAKYGPGRSTMSIDLLDVIHTRCSLNWFSISIFWMPLLIFNVNRQYNCMAGHKAPCCSVVHRS